MPEVKPEILERYLSEVLGEPVAVLRVVNLAAPEPAPVKFYGYGTPIRIDYQTANHARGSVVLHTMSPGPFGHEFMADRAHVLIWSHEAFNRLPRHTRSLDVGGFHHDGSVASLGGVEEFCLLTEYAEGESYAADLKRLRDTGELTGLDEERAGALCDYLVEIHRVRGSDRGLYVRRIRELVGHSECIMGLTDSYPPHPMIPAARLEEIEHRAVEWRWRLKSLTHRLRQVHGDFHPWNILFREAADFRVLDRSRGEFGDPADDVTSLTANYLFFSLQRSGRLEGAFEKLFRSFWERYLAGSGDREILCVAAPFFAFRSLVLASPLWYPALRDEVRERLLRFITAVLNESSFDPALVNQYCGV
jgi:hypothetical protein